MVTVGVISTEGHGLFSVAKNEIGPTSKARHVAWVCHEFSELGGAQGLKLG